jgi:DNA topoisomerase I
MSAHPGTSPRQLARRARLHYVTDDEPGIVRTQHGTGFAYRWQKRRGRISSPHRRRVQSLAIPPAWRDVWICGKPEGHLQATGRDDRGRKQYLYHERWQRTVNLAKFDRLLEMGRVLPAVRRRVMRDLKAPALTRKSVAALVVRLLDVTGIRVGNGEYLRDNDSYGLTTLQNRQVSVRGTHIEFQFRGKSGIKHHIALDDALLAKRIKRCRALRGRFVFQFREEGAQRAITSEDVNAYLAEISDGVLTAKDFRTWRASTFVASRLAVEQPPASEQAAKRALMAILRETAADLGNTVTVCRKYYVHGGLTDAFLSGGYARLVKRFHCSRQRAFTSDEQRLMHILKRLR